MQTTLNAAVESYLRAKTLSRGTRNEYFSTLRKWAQWGGGAPIEELRRKDIREFLDWVYERAVAHQGTNPGRTANKAREHLRAVISWAWEQEIIDSPPRFPKPREQRDVAGRHYLTKAEINALYFATHKMKRPRGWKGSISIGRYWRSALVLFFNYGLDTGTVWKSAPVHEPILWRHLSWERQSPDRDGPLRRSAAGERRRADVACGKITVSIFGVKSELNRRARIRAGRGGSSKVGCGSPDNLNG